MIRAVLFDLDGTLHDRDRSLKAFVGRQYERFLADFSHIPKEQYVSRFLALDQHGTMKKEKVYQSLTFISAIIPQTTSGRQSVRE